MNRLRWLLALFLMLALVAAACGSDDSDSSSGDETEAAADDESSDDSASDDSSADDSASDDSSADDSASDDGESDDEAMDDFDPEGVLRIAVTMDRYDTQINEVTAYGTVTHYGMNYHIFGTPLQLGLDGSVQPYLAESFEVVDDSTVTLTLREGLTFQDGTPYDAQIVADAFTERARLHNDEETTAFRSSAIPFIDTVEATSDTEVTFNLSAPVAGSLLTTLADNYGVIISPGSTPGTADVYGAGPYQIVDFGVEDKVITEKWDDFYDADSYQLAGVEWYHIPAIEAAQTALEADQVDLIATNPRDLDALLARGSFDGVVTNNQAAYQMGTCPNTPPFDDVKFRQAVNLAIDREQINQVVFGGNAEALQSFWPADSEFNVPGLLNTEADPEAAEALLEEIGWDGSQTLRLGHYPGFQTHILVVETIQGQLANVGIDSEIVVIESFIAGDYFSPPDNGGGLFLAQVNPGIQKILVGFAPGSAWNPCSYEDAEALAMANEINSGLLEGQELVDAWTEIQEYTLGQELIWLPTTTQPAVYVYNSDRVQGVEVGTVGLTGATFPSPYLAGVSMVAG